MTLLTIGLPTFGDLYPTGRWRDVVDLARVAEDVGIGGVVVPEHVVMGQNTAAYPFGTFPFPPEAPWLDALTVLTAMAAVTSTIRLQTGILVAAARPAAALAKQAATIEVLSGGRLDLGVGTGWQREELEACGVPFAERGQRLTDTMAACRALWSPGPATFSSATTSFVDLWCEPTPIGGGPAVLFSGSVTGRNLRRITELGDGWIPLPGAPVADLASGVVTLRAAWVAAGRPLDDLKVRGTLSTQRDADGRPDVDATLAQAPALLEAGATELTVSLRGFVTSPDDCADALAAIGRRAHLELGK